MAIQPHIKNRIYEAILKGKDKTTLTNPQYAKSLGINNSVLWKIKNGDRKILSDKKLIEIAQALNFDVNNRNEMAARTDVYVKIENDIFEAKNNSTALMLVDDTEIGKTFSARHIAGRLVNAYYVDCSQAKTRLLLARNLARAVGADHTGTYNAIKQNIKVSILALKKPVIILDEFGDLDYRAFMDVKELWNATEGFCGWYAMGADGLRKKIEDGISYRKVGYLEIFSRFNKKFMNVVPLDPEARKEFYANLIGDYLNVNLNSQDKPRINELIKKVMGSDANDIGGLRRAATIARLINKERENGETTPEQ